MEKELEQRQSNCVKIVLFGPESTGKTTLAKLLANHFDTAWVPEVMRPYLQQKWDLTGQKISKDDLLPIATGQMASENDGSKSANGFLFCDTNLLELKVYSDYYYGNCPQEIEDALNTHPYDFYFLTNIDVPWEADDLRDRPYDRSTLFRNFETALKQRNLPYLLLEGDVQTRLKTAITTIQNRF